jgi:hypothetical protein
MERWKLDGSTMSDLGLAALAVARDQLTKGVRGGVAPYGRFRSVEIDAYMQSVGLPNKRDITVIGNPWCSAACHWCFEQVTPKGDDGLPGVCPYPRTAGAIHAWQQIPETSKRIFPAPGFLFFIDRGKGRGHVGFVAEVPGGGMITTLEPDTASVTLSATGDAFGYHTWAPADGARGTLLGYAELG